MTLDEMREVVLRGLHRIPDAHVAGVGGGHRYWWVEFAGVGTVLSPRCLFRVQVLGLDEEEAFLAEVANADDMYRVGVSVPHSSHPELVKGDVVILTEGDQPGRTVQRVLRVMLAKARDLDAQEMDDLPMVDVVPDQRSWLAGHVRRGGADETVPVTVWVLDHLVKGLADARALLIRTRPGPAEPVIRYLSFNVPVDPLLASPVQYLTLVVKRGPGGWRYTLRLPADQGHNTLADGPAKTLADAYDQGRQAAQGWDGNV